MPKASLLCLACMAWLAAASAQTPAINANPKALIEQLKKDPNVLWLGEIYRDYSHLDGLKEFSSDMEEWKKNFSLPPEQRTHVQRYSILKLQSLNKTAHKQSQQWDYWLWYQMSAAEVEVFADADLSKKIKKEEKAELVIERDTMLVFNPDTFRDTMQAFSNEIPYLIRGYRMRELVYFDKKEALYKVIPLAIAPLKITRATYKKKKNEPATPLFWLPIALSAQPIDPSATPDMPYIRGVDMTMYFDEFEVHSEKQIQSNCTDTLLATIRREGATRCISETMEDDNPNYLQSIAEVSTTGTTVDTFVTFSPTTFEDIVTPVVNYASGKSFHCLRANHTFAWDARRRQLVVNVFSIALNMVRLDDKGKYLNEGAFFWYFPHQRYRK